MLIVGVLAGPTVASPATAAPVDRDAFRPVMHYTPQRNWMNDPNGLVYHQGRYHLFYQYNPRGSDWANMSWGHAVSTDLRHWRELPVAIRDDRDAQIYSGSAVVDARNTSGLGAAAAPPLVAMYTADYLSGRQAQSLAYSTDDGQTWTKYRGNPVIDRHSDSFRDPKVFWYDGGPSRRYWVAAVADPNTRKVLLYRSDDLLRWRYLSDFGPHGDYLGIWECPDLFPLPADGDPARIKWVMVISHNPATVDTAPLLGDLTPALLRGTGTRYVVGDFDGTQFTADGPPVDLDSGRDFYAGVTFNSTPDGRRIMMGWMSNWLYAQQTPTAPWRGAMALPRELRLRTVEGRPRLVASVVDSIAAGGRTVLRRGGFALHGRTILPVNRRAYRVSALFDPGTARSVGLTVRSSHDGTQRTEIRYDVAAGRLSVDRTKSGNVLFGPLFPSVDSVPVALRDGKLRLDVYVDASSVEVFAQNGRHSITDLVFPDPTSTGLSVEADGGRVHVYDLTVTALD
jgi:sucrose-6-phosphate hydrolase SacC (GH32 family)